MKKYILLLSALLLTLFVQAQTKKTRLNEKLGDVVLENKLPASFSYQALITRNGKVASFVNLKLEITLQDEEGNQFLVEEHTAKTSRTGMVKLAVGSGRPKKGKLNQVDWNKGIFIAIKADFGSGYESLGAPVKMMAAPYALYAANAPLIRSNTTEEDAPIFQVQNSDGYPLFTVYEGGYVTMNVADETSTRRPRGGFAVKSFRGESTAPRLQVADGRVDMFVDPLTRRPRGGFAVKTYGHLRDGESGETKTLFSMNDRAAYFTLDKNAKGSSFQLRSRCDEKVVMAFTKEGKIQTRNEAADVIESLPEASPSTSFEVDWVQYSIPLTYSEFPGFTNLIRWAIPRVKLDGNETTKYDIRIEDEPSGARLSDYIRVGEVKELQATKFGLALASNLALDNNFVFPNGKITVWSTEIPSLQKVIEFNDQKQLSVEDVLELKNADENARMLQTDNEFTIELKATRITPNASFEHLLLNTDLRFEIQGEWAQCLKAERDGMSVKFIVTDRTKFETIATVGNTHTIPMKLVFPNNIYPSVSFELKVYVML